MKYIKNIDEPDTCSVCGEPGDNYVDGRCLCDDCLEDFENTDFDGFHVTDDDDDYWFEESRTRRRFPESSSSSSRSIDAKTKKMVLDIICEQVDRENKRNGFSTGYSTLSDRDRFDNWVAIKSQGIEIEGDDILKDGEKVGKIIRNYASRRVNLCYKQLKPKIEWFDDATSSMLESKGKPMKKLNITKEQFNRSSYFQKKYGALKYVSESGKLYRTSKGRVLKFTEASEDVVDVIFKKDRDNGTVVAFFPDTLRDGSCNPGMLRSYEHDGQHSEASIDYFNECIPATEDEYSQLLMELEQVYDDCRLVVKRRIR